MELLIREDRPGDAEEVVAIFNSVIEAGIARKHAKLAGKYIDEVLMERLL